MYHILKRIYSETQLSLAVLLFTNKEKIHHIVNVLRLKEGDDLIIFNQTGEFLAKIEKITGKSEIKFAMQKKLRDAPVDTNITIAFSPIKQERLKFLIEKCTEIGCTNFIPVITERSIVRSINLNKLQSYVISASEQSGRFTVPTLHKEIALKSFLKNQTNRIVFCDERESSTLISALALKGHDITILIGPEGGFTDQERALLKQTNDVYPVSLGTNILRSETAAIFSLSCIISR